MFHIISFLETNEVEVVPSCWVDGDQCAWPRLRGESLTRAVKLVMKPKKEWKERKSTYTTGAVRQNPLTGKASNKDIEFNIIKWLHLAGDREGGRRERLKKREAQQHIADPH